MSVNRIDWQNVLYKRKIAETYFMTPNVTVTFVLGLTLFMTPKGHGVIRGRRDLL